MSLSALRAKRRDNSIAVVEVGRVLVPVELKQGLHRCDVAGQVGAVPNR